jgi:hypothetical protein
VQHEQLLAQYNAEHQRLKKHNLSLDMTRSKPSPEQLGLANDLLSGDQYITQNGSDCRNYGGLDGLPEMKQLFANILETSADNIIVGGNSSLTMMYDTLTRT